MASFKLIDDENRGRILLKGHMKAGYQRRGLRSFSALNTTYTDGDG